MTKYHSIREALRKQIERDYAPGRSFPSQADLAESYGVSLVTMRRALQGLVDEGLLIRSHGKRTIVAAPPLSGESGAGGGRRTILVLRIGASPSFDEEVILIQQRLCRLGYVCAVACLDLWDEASPPERQIAEILDGAAPAGVVCGGVAHEFDTVSGLLSEVTCPIVYAQPGRPVPASYVAVDMSVAAYEGARHLRHIGCRRIRYFGAPSKPGDWPWRRAAGLARYLEDFEPGVSMDEFVIHTGYTMESAHRVASREFDAGRVPDGILAGNDVLALGIMVAARERSIRIPDDLAVVGSDDIRDARTYAPPLTTVAQPRDQAAAELVRILHAALSEPAPPTRREVLLAPTLMVRDSTAPSLRPVATV